MTEIMDLTGSVEQGINEVYEIFETDVNPGFVERTANFRAMGEDIPAQIEACVAAALDV